MSQQLLFYQVHLTEIFRKYITIQNQNECDIVD